jgi:hypothetical protein
MDQTEEDEIASDNEVRKWKANLYGQAIVALTLVGIITPLFGFLFGDREVAEAVGASMGFIWFILLLIAGGLYWRSIDILKGCRR